MGCASHSYSTYMKLLGKWHCNKPVGFGKEAWYAIAMKQRLWILWGQMTWLHSSKRRCSTYQETATAMEKKSSVFHCSLLWLRGVLHIRRAGKQIAHCLRLDTCPRMTM